MQRRLISLLDLAEGDMQGRPDVRCLRAHLPPMTALRDLEAVLLGQVRILLVAIRLLQGTRPLLVVDIGDALEEQEGKDVGLVVGGVDGSAQDVRGRPEVQLQLGERDRVGRGQR